MIYSTVAANINIFLTISTNSISCLTLLISLLGNDGVCVGNGYLACGVEEFGDRFQCQLCTRSDYMDGQTVLGLENEGLGLPAIPRRVKSKNGELHFEFP